MPSPSPAAFDPRLNGSKIARLCERGTPGPRSWTHNSAPSGWFFTRTMIGAPVGECAAALRKRFRTIVSTWTRSTRTTTGSTMSRTTSGRTAAISSTTSATRRPMSVGRRSGTKTPESRRSRSRSASNNLDIRSAARETRSSASRRSSSEIRPPSEPSSSNQADSPRTTASGSAISCAAARSTVRRRGSLVRRRRDAERCLWTAAPAPEEVWPLKSFTRLASRRFPWRVRSSQIVLQHFQ